MNRENTAGINSFRAIIDRPIYAPDKPRRCSTCRFWHGKQKGCSHGKKNCYYLLPPPQAKNPCDGCCYAADHPCIGFCMKKVMREVLE